MLLKENQNKSQSLNNQGNTLWSPKMGDAGSKIINSQSKLSQEERDVLKNESLYILSKCIPPYKPSGHHSGLIVGNIQSGKTLSFATVAALAQDNQYRLIIVITGTSKILNSQSIKRLRQLLNADGAGYTWQFLKDPKVNQSQNLKRLISRWKSSSNLNSYRKTLLITVLKNAVRLKSLSGLLNKLDLQEIPALVIDDEADQAGLNLAVSKNSESSTYRELNNIRKALPHHTYLGYTATPQAPLLINVMDVLSAKFVQILTPGAEYIGGKQLFSHRPSLVRIIPESQIPSKHDSPTIPPKSLQDALRLFFIEVSAGLLQSELHQKRLVNRSMLIHPSIFTIDHLQFFRWVQHLQNSWSTLITTDDRSDDQDKKELISDFKTAYSDLAKTERNIPPFDQILSKLGEAMHITDIHEINQRQPSGQFSGFENIDELWSSGYAHILIGGQALERGFTIEGLTVTYMPRGVGGGQVDTIQQRARFYGYNKKRLGYCRIYLDQKSNDVYQKYIDHEDRLRKSLDKHASTGKPLSEWRRVFFLNKSLKPTRDSVLGIKYSRGVKPNRPYDAMPPLHSIESLNENKRLVKNFIKSFQFSNDDVPNNFTLSQRHKLNKNIPVKYLLEKLLVPLKIHDPQDSLNFFTIIFQIKRFLENNPDSKCTAYLMRNEAKPERTVKNERIEAHQGRNPSNGYRGDRSLYSKDTLTVQIHEFSKIKDSGGSVLAVDVPIIALSLPTYIARGLIDQQQNTL